ncbi:MAG: hypothetical protein J5746_06505 [Victivallales bacterium]|nr:hypothetical protein [Victivallales bacterium]
MSAMQIMWAVIGAQWVAMVGFCGWTVTQIKALEKQFADLDKNTSVKLASIDAKLGSISDTLQELKETLKEMR